MKVPSPSQRLGYSDRLAVWLTARRLGIVGRVTNDTYDLLIDRDLAVSELNRVCDVVVTAQGLRTTIDKFATMRAPYQSWEPPVSKAAKARKASRSQKPKLMTAYEMKQIGPHLRGVMCRPVERQTTA